MTPASGTFARILPVVLALSPVGFLFGVLAGQAGWSSPDVFFMSLIGFTGSGQFAYLGFAHPDNEHIQYFTVFLIILCINLRYIPMSLSASTSIAGGALTKAFLSHWLADESYAVERKEDGTGEKAVITAVGCRVLDAVHIMRRAAVEHSANSRPGSPGRTDVSNQRNPDTVEPG